MKRNETKRNEAKRNEAKRNEAKRNEAKRNGRTRSFYGQIMSVAKGTTVGRRPSRYGVKGPWYREVREGWKVTSAYTCIHTYASVSYFTLLHPNLPLLFSSLLFSSLLILSISLSMAHVGVYLRAESEEGRCHPPTHPSIHPCWV